MSVPAIHNVVVTVPASGHIVVAITTATDVVVTVSSLPLFDEAITGSDKPIGRTAAQSEKGD